MIKTAKIEFSIWENEKALCVFLEPAGSEFVIDDGNTVLAFVAKTEDDNFLWHTRFSREDNSVSLYPECKGLYDIFVYKNDVLIY